MKKAIALLALLVAFSVTAQQKRNIGPYSKLHIRGSFDVVLVPGEGPATITAKDQETIDRVKTENNGEVLDIFMEKGKYTSGKITITLPYKNLDDISLNGSGSVTSKSSVKSADLKLSLTGSGDIDLEIEAKTASSEVTGSGDMELKGNTSEFTARLSGSGNLKAQALKSGQTQVEVSGSGDATVFAAEQLKARVSGSGGIKYGGNPKTEDTKVSGSGSIEKI